MPTDSLKPNQRKEWAKLIYLKESLTQQEIADRVGVSRATVNKWAREWEGLKLNLLQTREERISSTLSQLDELDRSIAAKEEGKRFPTTAEADIRRKLTADLEALEQDASVRDIYIMCPADCSILSGAWILKRQRSSVIISTLTSRTE